MELSSNLLWIVILTILISLLPIGIGGYAIYTKGMTGGYWHLVYGVILFVLMILVISFVKSMECPACTPPPITPVAK